MRSLRENNQISCDSCMRRVKSLDRHIHISKKDSPKLANPDLKRSSSLTSIRDNKKNKRAAAPINLITNPPSPTLMWKADFQKIVEKSPKAFRGRPILKRERQSVNNPIIDGMEPKLESSSVEDAKHSPFQDNQMSYDSGMRRVKSLADLHIYISKGDTQLPNSVLERSKSLTSITDTQINTRDASPINLITNPPSPTLMWKADFKKIVEKSPKAFRGRPILKRGQHLQKAKRIPKKPTSPPRWSEVLQNIVRTSPTLARTSQKGNPEILLNPVSQIPSSVASDNPRNGSFRAQQINLSSPYVPKYSDKTLSTLKKSKSMSDIAISCSLGIGNSQINIEPVLKRSKSFTSDKSCARNTGMNLREVNQSDLITNIPSPTLMRKNDFQKLMDQIPNRYIIGRPIVKSNQEHVFECVTFKPSK